MWVGNGLLLIFLPCVIINFYFVLFADLYLQTLKNFWIERFYQKLKRFTFDPHTLGSCISSRIVIQSLVVAESL